MRSMVVGLVFNEDESAILLIEKKTPKWQAGYFNGVGGKIEEGETPVQAMIRECQEESGLVIDQWRCCAVLHAAEFRIFFFWAHADLTQAKTTTKEDIIVCPLRDALWNGKLMPNLHWIIPLCLNFDKNIGSDMSGPVHFSIMEKK